MPPVGFIESDHQDAPQKTVEDLFRQNIANVVTSIPEEDKLVFA